MLTPFIIPLLPFSHFDPTLLLIRTRVMTSYEASSLSLVISNMHLPRHFLTEILKRPTYLQSSKGFLLPRVPCSLTNIYRSDSPPSADLPSFQTYFQKCWKAVFHVCLFSHSSLLLEVQSFLFPLTFPLEIPLKEMASRNPITFAVSLSMNSPSWYFLNHALVWLHHCPHHLSWLWAHPFPWLHCNFTMSRSMPYSTLYSQ